MKVPEMSKQFEVLISYAWGGESEDIANALEKTFQEKGIKLVRDKTDLGYKGLIREFMQQIGQGKCVLLIISDKYLKSKNCMFELLEIARNGDFYDRIFPILLRDANIYDAVERVKYINYWDGKIEELNEAMKGVKVLANLEGITDEIDLYNDIRNNIANLTNTLNNMNNLTTEIHKKDEFTKIVDAIKRRLEADPQAPKAQNSQKTLGNGERESLQRQLSRARRCLQILEEQIAGYGLRVPVDLQLELEEQRQKVAKLEASVKTLETLNE